MRARRYRWAGWGIAATLWLWPVDPGQAETMLEMPLDRVVKAADLGIHGVVVEAKSRWGDRKRSVIWTDYVVKIEETLHGTPPGPTVVVTQQGGALEGVVLQVGSNPRLEVGDEIVVMLKRADFLDGMARGDSRPKYTIVGVAQGTYYVIRDGDSATAFKDYAQLAILPRPDGRATRAAPPVSAAFTHELEKLREAVKASPQDRDLARRLAEAERLFAGAPPQPRRKPDEGGSSTAKSRAGAEPDLNVKPTPEAPGTGRVAGDAPEGSGERERALKALVEAQAARYRNIVQPIPLDELKARIRRLSSGS